MLHGQMMHGRMLHGRILMGQEKSRLVLYLSPASWHWNELGNKNKKDLVVQ